MNETIFSETNELDYVINNHHFPQPRNYTKETEHPSEQTNELETSGFNEKLSHHSGDTRRSHHQRSRRSRLNGHPPNISLVLRDSPSKTKQRRPEIIIKNPELEKHTSILKPLKLSDKKRTSIVLED